MGAGPLGPVGNGSAGNTPGTGAPRSGLRVADRGAGPDVRPRVERWRGCWPSSPHSNGRSCVNELAPDWPTPGRTANVWVGQQRQPRTRPRSEDYIALASPKLRSPADSRSGAPRCAESWAIPPRNRSARLPYAGSPKGHNLGKRDGCRSEDYVGVSPFTESDL